MKPTPTGPDPSTPSPDVVEERAEELTAEEKRAGVDDPKDKTLVDFGVRAPPETFVVDADGNVAFRRQGPVGPGQLDELLARLG